MPSVTLKMKLISFSIMGLVLILAIVGQGVIYLRRIENANTLREDLLRIAQTAQDARIAGKAYLQFYEDRFADALDQAFELGEDRLAPLNNGDHAEDAGKIGGLFTDYRTNFQRLVSLHKENVAVEESLVELLEEAKVKVDNVVDQIQKKEFELQMDGDLLSSAETNLLGTSREAKYLALFLEAKHQKFMLTGDTLHFTSYVDYMSQTGNGILAVFSAFASATGDGGHIRAAKAFQEDLVAGAELFKQSRDLFTDEGATVVALDGIGADMMASTDEFIKTATEANQKEKRNAISVIMAIVASSAVLFLVLAWFLIRSITLPLLRTTERLKDIAQGDGDLTKRLTIDHQDEIGTMASWFNTFIEKIQAIITEVAQNSTPLSDASSELSATSTQMASDAQEMQDQSATVASATEELSSNLTNVARSADLMSSSVNTVATAIEEMSSSLGEVAKNCAQASNISREADSEASEASGTMSQLSQAADEIGKVLDTISDIADQTNLLALNATIEAASAGEAGKGFAVVANEVKELAKQTAVATDEIGRQIQDMQSNTAGAVDAIERIAKIIGEINRITQVIASAVEEQSATTNEIASSIGGASQAASEIASNIEQASGGATEISTTIQGVAGMSETTASGARTTIKSAEALKAMSEQLQAVVDQFKI